MEAAIVVVGVITIIYTYLGGMKAVIWTDLIQFIIKIAGAVLAFAFVLIGVPMMIVIGLGSLVFSIIATVKASNGESYHYPLTLRLVS